MRQLPYYYIVDIRTGEVVLSNLTKDEAHREIDDFVFFLWKCGEDDPCKECHKMYRIQKDKELARKLFNKYRAKNS